MDTDTDMGLMWNNTTFALLTVLLVLILLQGELWAKDVEMQSSISTSLDYSDNIDLDHTNEKDDFILRVTPAISFKKEGARVKSNLNYSLSGLLYASETDENEIQHRLAANAESEIIKHSLFLDVDAGISQELLDPNSSASSDGVSGSQNLTETYTYGFSPYWQKKWGNYADSTFRYGYNEVKYSGNGGEDSREDTANLDISSGRIFNLITWDLNYAHSEIDYDNSDTTKTDVTTLRLGYQYSRQLALRLTTGYEDYDSPQASPGDSGWTVGFQWTPSPRNTLDLDIGHRFFGNTYRLDYQHRGKRTTWNLTYDEDVVNQRNQIRDNNQEQVDNPDNIISPVATNINQSELYLSRTARSNFSYLYSKSTINWGIYLERRYYEDTDNEDEDNYGTDLSWAWRIGRRTTMNTRLLWDYYEDVIADDAQTRTELSLSLNRRMTPDTTGFFRISHMQNDADTKTNEYTESRVSVGLSKQF